MVWAHPAMQPHIRCQFRDLDRPKQHSCSVWRGRTTARCKGLPRSAAYCTDGMILAAGTSQPRRVGGQGIAMN
jgi:hypothetical protein